MCNDHAVGMLVAVDILLLERLLTDYGVPFSRLEGIVTSLFSKEHTTERRFLTTDEKDGLNSLTVTCRKLGIAEASTQRLVGKLRTTILSGHYDLEGLAEYRESFSFAN